VKPKSIVQTARTFALMILICLCVSVLLEWRGLSQVEDEIGDLSNRVSPLLTETKDLARLGSQLRALTETTRTVPDLDALQQLQARLDALLQDVGAHIVRQASTDDLLAQAKDSLASLFDEQSKVLSSNLQIDRMILLSLDILRRMTRALEVKEHPQLCLLYTSPSPRDRTRSRMPSSA